MKSSRTLRIIGQILILVAIVAAAFYFAGIAKESEAVRQVVAAYGYAGVFVVALISGFNLAVPIPAVTFLPLFLESGLAFWPTIFVIAAGMTLADTAAYILGRVGRHVASEATTEKVLRRLEGIRERYQWAPLAVLLLFASIAPLPNEILVAPLAFLGYRVRQIFPVVFVGNVIFNTLYSQGVISIFGLF